jgi:putative transcriptional regulator
MISRAWNARHRSKSSAALSVSQGEFSARFHIPLGTLRDWEQGRKAPDAAARAYLVAIGRPPQAVREAYPSP